MPAYNIGTLGGVVGQGFGAGGGIPSWYNPSGPAWNSGFGGSQPTPAATSPASGTYAPPSGTGAFNLSPAPTSGQGPYGAVPGQLGLPDAAGDLDKRLPGLNGLNAGATSAIESGLHGELPPDVISQIQDASARFGVSSGMPGTGLSRNRSLRDIGRTSLDQQHWAVGALPGFVGSTSQTQTLNPALQNEIANQNALNRAAPDPNQKAKAEQDLLMKYLSMTQGRGGNYGGGGGGFTPSFSGGGAGLNPWAFFPSGGGSGSPAPTRTTSPAGGGYAYLYPSDDPAAGFGTGNYQSHVPTVPGLDQSWFDDQFYAPGGSLDFGGGLDYGGGVPYDNFEFTDPFAPDFGG